MRRIVLILSALAVVSGSLASILGAQEGSSKPRPEEPKAAAPAPPTQDKTEADPKLAARGQTDQATKQPRYLKIFLAEFRALDLDKKTISFETDDGKAYTVQAQVPEMPEAVERAEQLAQSLKPGDRIRMLCRVDGKEQPTLVLSLHMVGDKAPVQFR